MLTSTVALCHNNATHGDDTYVVRCLDAPACLDAVMDGVTGRCGGEASQAVAAALARAVLTSPDDVVTVLQEVNQDLYGRGGGHWWLTTVAVAWCQASVLSVVSVGDSAVFLVRSDTCQALYSPIGGFGQALRSRALGACPLLLRPYRAEITLEPGDRLVLATDGVSANIARRELVEIVQRAETPVAATEHINALLTARQATPTHGGGQRDDWTALVRFFS